MPELNDEELFQRRLPWYVNGRLQQDERAWMDAYLRSHPEHQEKLRIDRLMRQALHEGEIAYEGRQGLPEFLARMRAEPVAVAAPPNPRWQRWLDWFGVRPGSPALAAIAALLVLQLGMFGARYYWHGDARDSVVQESWRSAAPTLEQGPVLRITFKPDTEERKLRLLLVQIRGSIVGGPGQLGNYIVRVPADSLDAALKQVAAETFVESVERLHAMPNPD